MTTKPVMHEIPVFAYGTLRPGQYNAVMVRGTECGVEPLDATVDGFALYANQSASYPYLVREDGATAKGTLYLMKANPKFGRIHQMELGAGYNHEFITAKLADGTEVNALAWTWDRPQYLGERIESGDWVEWSATHEPSFYRAKSRNWK